MVPAAVNDKKEEIHALEKVGESSFRFKSMMKKFKRMNSSVNTFKSFVARVTPTNMASRLSAKNVESITSGILYNFTDGMLFGELAACQAIPRRMYDAEACVDTELYYFSMPDIVHVLTENSQAYAAKHISMIAKQHLDFLKMNNALARHAIERYRHMPLKGDVQDPVSKKNQSKSVMANALMNLIHVNKESRLREKKREDGGELYNDKSEKMMERILSELKNVSSKVEKISLRLDQLEENSNSGDNRDMLADL
jgi:hypothetical protein